MKALPSFLSGIFLTIAALAGLYIIYIWQDVNNVATTNDVVLGKVFFNNPIQKQVGSFGFSGTASIEDVAYGQSFYSNSGELKTGTATTPTDYSLQGHEEFDNNKSGDFPTTELVWVNSATNVWLDPRTKLYWSNKQSPLTNKFPNSDHSLCGFFSNVNREGYSASDTTCGEAINYCANLLLDLDDDGVAEERWYLPSQKELQQAYIDGISTKINESTPNSINTDLVWSATESSLRPEVAWAGSLATGAMSGDNAKTQALPFYCVTKNTPVTVEETPTETPVETPAT